MEIRHLRYFITAAKEEHFGRAAGRLHIAQPALSRQIRELEESLGVQLFERLPRGVRLSKAGEQFLDDAKRALASFEYAIVQARRRGSVAVPRLRIGFIEPIILNSLLPKTLRRFRSENPHVMLELLPMHSSAQVDALQAVRIDAGITMGIPGNVADFDHLTLAAEKFQLALPDTHPLAEQASVKLADLRGEEFVWVRRDIAPIYTDHLLSACISGGLSPKISIETTNEATILSLVSVGAGLGIVMSRGWRVPEGVVLRPIVDLQTIAYINLVWLRKQRSKTLDSFIEALSESKDIATGQFQSEIIKAGLDKDAKGQC